MGVSRGVWCVYFSFDFSSSSSFFSELRPTVYCKDVCTFQLFFLYYCARDIVSCMRLTKTIFFSSTFLLFSPPKRSRKTSKKNPQFFSLLLLKNNATENSNFPPKKFVKGLTKHRKA